TSWSSESGDVGAAGMGLHDTTGLPRGVHPTECFTRPLNRSPTPAMYWFGTGAAEAALHTNLVDARGNAWSPSSAGTASVSASLRSPPWVGGAPAAPPRTAAPASRCS